MFKSSSLLPHTEGQGEAAFDWRSKIPANKRPVCDTEVKQEDTVCDRSLFIEPVQWMAGFVNELEGKVMSLSYPKFPNIIFFLFCIIL